jgi:hypothetical protein
MLGFKFHRPSGFKGKGDVHLTQIAKELTSYLGVLQKKFEPIIGHFSNREIKDISSALVEFAEDIHNDIGIWRSLENYNREFFGTPLPLVVRAGEKVAIEGINPYRLRHFMWVMYPQINEDFIPSPDDADFCQIAEDVSKFLKSKFEDIPRDSGIRYFLDESSEFGWEIKEKLIWLGTHSYLFRHCFINYVIEHGNKPDVGTTDDFICQATTEWSGLGAIDILAATLDLEQERCQELRSWYERHAAVYNVLSIDPPMMKVLNTFNDQTYLVKIDDRTHLFKKNPFVFGSLVPWKGEWYWSGQQRGFQDIPQEYLHALKKDFIQKSSRIVYRYLPDLAQKAKEITQYYYEIYLKHFGKPLIVFPNVKKADQAMKDFFRAANKARAKDLGEKLLKKEASLDSMSVFTDDKFRWEDPNGIAIFYNQDEGLETFFEFNPVLSGFKKNGKNLFEDEAEMIRQFIYANQISPKFVEYLIQQNGEASIYQAFLINQAREKPSIEYLLRRYKGEFYRNRYPSFSFVDV